MKATEFAAQAEAEESHWWFVGRRKLFARLIDRMGLAKEAAILDVGSGIGANLRLLREEGFNEFQGLDLNPEAQRYCSAKGLGHVQLGSILDLPFRDNEFDLLIATDVIEHVDNDALALEEAHRVLRPGGRAIITVPAFMSLWGLQDVVAEHRRRYRMPQLLDRIRQARLEVLDRYYFNYLLFVPIFVTRKLLHLLRIPLRSEFSVNFGLMNAVLRHLFAFDTRSAGYLKPPFGVSILAICRKPLKE
jgi:ubiquinone/menaquinone biosynthesis C-methylase UbiE